MSFIVAALVVFAPALVIAFFVAIGLAVFLPQVMIAIGILGVFVLNVSYPLGVTMMAIGLAGVAWLSSRSR